MAEPIKISELTESSSQGYVMETVTEGGVQVSRKYNLANIEGQLKGYQFAGYLSASQYVGAYTNPFTTYVASDKFFYLVENVGLVGLLDSSSTQHTYTQNIGESIIIIWNGSSYVKKTLSSIVGSTEITTPQGMIGTIVTNSGVSNLYKYDLSRLPIIVKTWSEFVDAMEDSNSTEIHIHIANDIECELPDTLDETTSTEIEINATTTKIVIDGAKISNVWRLLLTSTGRDSALEVNWNAELELYSTYNPITTAGYKGTIIFNADKVININFLDCSASFLQLTNNTTNTANVYGIARNLYGGGSFADEGSYVTLKKAYLNSNLIIENVISGHGYVTNIIDATGDRSVKSNSSYSTVSGDDSLVISRYGTTTGDNVTALSTDNVNISGTRSAVIATSSATSVTHNNCIVGAGYTGATTQNDTAYLQNLKLGDGSLCGGGSHSFAGSVTTQGAITASGGNIIASNGQVIAGTTVSANNGDVTSTYNGTTASLQSVKSQSDTNASNISSLTTRVEALETYWYGVEWYSNVSDPTCTRIGNPNLHRTCPIQNGMIGGLLTQSGVFTPFANQSDWTGNVMDGSAGHVMVKIPAFWWKFETETTSGVTTYRVKLSQLPLDGYKYQREMYVGAFEAALDRTNLILSSVINTTAQYRGGNNSTTYDSDVEKTFCGKPATNISLTNFRTYARNNGNNHWNCCLYECHKTLYWLFVVEYATLNSQATFNSSKDSNGYRQGGLGAGVSTVSGSDWLSYNGYNPFVNCGAMIDSGNTTAIKSLTYTGIGTVSGCKYHGIEQPFGHMWEWTDGVYVYNDVDNTQSIVYTCYDSEYMASSLDTTHWNNEGNTWYNVANYIATMIFGDNGNMLPLSTSGIGSATTYFCDYSYMANVSTTQLKGCLSGGHAINGSTCGLACWNSNFDTTHFGTNIDSRLCYI